jgi:hypothetical protein
VGEIHYTAVRFGTGQSKRVIRETLFSIDRFDMELVEAPHIENSILLGALEINTQQGDRIRRIIREAPGIHSGFTHANFMGFLFGDDFEQAFAFPGSILFNGFVGWPRARISRTYGEVDDLLVPDNAEFPGLVAPIVPPPAVAAAAPDGVEVRIEYEPASPAVYVPASPHYSPGGRSRSSSSSRPHTPSSSASSEPRERSRSQSPGMTLTHRVEALEAAVRTLQGNV